ncbi:hypothetical protein DOTSEDRAFT_70808 [Dothistroma septosporum NZE10]|uniref:Uncharacterized protein n=1 Tax=Dothistroma septosporum (strain NZE10 / CBS 128990) TaxID=675120 RepID=N1PN77_DOTSN|nr:hypothetical protein DOTSEDRAFT_70808 [Dothistroma septosporum NZE10]
MSYFENDNGSWSGSGRQASWEHPAPPSRTGTGSAMSTLPESTAFASQFEEIDRATDNLMKSGKWVPGAAQGAVGAGNAPPRRDSMPAMARGYDYNADPRLIGGPSRHQSVSEFSSEGARPGSAGLQGFYAGQRFPGGRQSEAEQVLQTKRKMAAQRERELRNYHQEQQYNRTVSGVKTDRSMSPNTMSEDDRRDLIARQHRALYGDNSSLYSADGSRRGSQDIRAPSGARGPSPLAYDPFSAQAQSGAEGVVQMPPRDRPENNASPASNAPAQQPSFGLLNEPQQQSRATSNSSQGGSPPISGQQKGSISGVMPIGTRPAQAPGAAPGLSKRSTTPLTPSSLSFGFNAGDAQNTTKDERSNSAASNAALGSSGLGNWGSNSANWGSGKSTLAVQPSVWG